MPRDTIHSASDLDKLEGYFAANALIKHGVTRIVDAGAGGWPWAHCASRSDLVLLLGSGGIGTDAVDGKRQ